MKMLMKVERMSSMKWLSLTKSASFLYPSMLGVTGNESADRLADMDQADILDAFRETGQEKDVTIAKMQL